MVFTSSSTLIHSKLPIASAKSQVSQLCSSFHKIAPRQCELVTCSAKFPVMEGFNDPGKRLAFLNYTKDKLWAAIPGSVKQFPWEKAESVALRKLLVIGKETLKWSLFAFFGFSCIFDIPYSISRNKELVIPFGLFVGSLLAKYLDQISQELLHDHKDEHVTRRFLGISVFFVIVKFVSTYFPGGNSDFLVHVGNGGLMQVVWNWKNMPEQDGESSTSEDIPAN